MHREHMEGFDNESFFVAIFAQARSECPSLKSWTIKDIISNFAPDFVASLFQERPCVRKLKFIGLRDFDLTSEEIAEFSKDMLPFKDGEIYESTVFNGATYSIKGYDKKIGAAYFEWLD